jgi:uncharacterized protein YbjQ (UPF0145 family)
MIITTTSTIPNAEIIEIISVVHNRVVLGTNLFSDISAGFSDIFGGKNTAYEKRLAEITNQVIEGLKENAKKQKADALIDLKIDVDEISGGSKSMFMVTAIATSVKLNKQIFTNESISIEFVNQQITKHKILKSIEDGSFSPTDFVENYLINFELPQAFEPYIRWINRTTLSWQDSFALYIGNLNDKNLFDMTVTLFSKDNRTEIEQVILKTIFKHLVVDYKKVYEILDGDDDMDKKRLCLNLLYHYNKNYTKNDFELITKILVKLKEVFPKKSTEEIGTGLMSKGDVYWRCFCGTKNTSGTARYCSKCSLDEYGNKAQTRHLSEVITRLEDLLIVNASLV